jgi:hypothetical protein
MYSTKETCRHEGYTNQPRNQSQEGRRTVFANKILKQDWCNSNAQWGNACCQHGALSPH